MQVKFVTPSPVLKQQTTQSKKLPESSRRSSCPLACSLDIVGDRWTLLIVRDLLFGHSRFKDFAASPEGIPTNILSDRLERLLRHRLVERAAAGESPKRSGYRLTKKGRALRRVLKAMRDWGLKWEPGTRDLISG